MLTQLRECDERAVARLAAALRVRPATARCLVARGVVEPADAQGFIDPRLAALRPPAGLAGLTSAVGRIADAVAGGERIGVFGDYDVDGVTTCALLASFLRAAGATVEAAVARRDAGYGFGIAAVEDFVARGCAVIITGDCGTSDLEAIAAAAAHGVEVIVVDHHTVPSAEALHPAYALVNPFRADSTFPFRGLASVGLAFYVAAAVRTELRARGHFEQRGLAEPDVRDLLDLVALGTIADLVPLASENRILTSLGLRKLRARPGIAALLALAGTSPDDELDARTVAWRIAPRLNAPGRLGAAAPALQLLLADASTAAEHAQTIEAANNERRVVQDRVVAEAMAMLGERDPGPAIVLAGEGWPAGVVGIVAAKLVDKFQRPAFVVGIDPATGIGRGSARTIGGVNLYDALAAAAPHLDRFGGHAAAAGFTVRRELVAAMSETIAAAVGAASQLAEGSGPVARVTIGGDGAADAEVRLTDVDERLAEELAGLGPFGQDNREPTLVTRNARVTAVRRVGADDAHLKLTVTDDAGNTRTCIGFGLGPRDCHTGDRVDLAFLPTISTWQGRRSAELTLRDFTILA